MNIRYKLYAIINHNVSYLDAKCFDGEYKTTEKLYSTFRKPWSEVSCSYLRKFDNFYCFSFCGYSALRSGTDKFKKSGDRGKMGYRAEGYASKADFLTYRQAIRRRSRASRSR